ncbi:STE3-domain-containing protein [Tricholoma matsutake]|nr:STE3-domain-containing protein [Tricholoma matsutake 945]
MSHAPPNWTFSMFSFIGFILCCIPFPWQLAAWNTGTCLFMAWTGLACLNSFVNSIVWNGNVINWAPVWCDISARIYIGINVAIPATSLCIARRLYRITAIRNVMITRAERRQTVMIDFAIGVGLPVLGVILQYIPEGHRFDIFEDVGCFPAIYNTPVALILVSGPPILIGCVSAFYGVMSIWAFNNSRKQFNELLSGSRLTNYRYLRLICLSAVVSFVTLILGTFALIVNCIRGIEPWKGWADTHLDFSHINFYPAIFWRSIPIEETSIELSRWLSVMCAFIFFAFFGFAEEARKNYCNAIQFLVKRIPNTSVSSFRLSFFESSKYASLDFRGDISTHSYLPDPSLVSFLLTLAAPCRSLSYKITILRSTISTLDPTCLYPSGSAVL